MFVYDWKLRVAKWFMVVCKRDGRRVLEARKEKVNHVKKRSSAIWTLI